MTIEEQIENLQRQQNAWARVDADQRKTNEAREAEERKAREAREKAEEEKKKNAREQFEASVRDTFMQTEGVTEADWQRLRSSLIDEALKKRATEIEHEHRSANRRYYRSRF